jgi:hypothetical protein
MEYVQKYNICTFTTVYYYNNIIGKIIVANIKRSKEKETSNAESLHEIPRN